MDDVCPMFGAESAYVTRQGDQLAWHRKYGEAAYVEYLKLHFVTQGMRPPLDNNCAE
jgi:hypothetical protein